MILIQSSDRPSDSRRAARVTNYYILSSCLATLQLRLLDGFSSHIFIQWLHFYEVDTNSCMKGAFILSFLFFKKKTKTKLLVLCIFLTCVHLLEEANKRTGFENQPDSLRSFCYSQFL